MCVYLSMYACILIASDSKSQRTQRRASIYTKLGTGYQRVGSLRGEYAERRTKYDIIFRFSLKMEYPRAYKWNIIEYLRIFIQ